MRPKIRHPAPFDKSVCRSSNRFMTDDPVLDAVGPRLRAVRQQGGATLAGVPAPTGISVSTVSRLESGGRKPTLELLLALARFYQVPLDDLVGAPEAGDPRVRLQPFSRG